MTASIPNEASLLQMAGGLRDAFAPHAQHVGDQLLRHDQFVGLQPVQAEQKPPAKLLVQRVMAVAHRRLGHLRQQCLRVSKQQMLHGPAPVEFVFQGLPLQLIGRPRALHDCPAGGGFSTHEQGNPDDAFVADHGDLGRGAIFHHTQQGDDAVHRKADMSHPPARFVQSFPQW
ncbi:hypothetical protein D3C87_1506540 [compost metagenome]